MSNQIAIPSYLDDRSLSPIRGTLEGAWRLRSLMEYKGAYRGWCTPEKESWGPRDYLFEPGFLTIYRPDETHSVSYTWSRAKRLLVIDDETYFVSDLTRRELVLHGCGLRYIFERIEPQAIHNRPSYKVSNFSKFLGYWRIDGQYKRKGGQWRLQQDFRRAPGLAFWYIPRMFSLKSSSFGQGPKDFGDSYYSFNERYNLINLKQSAKIAYRYHFAEEDGVFWAYELESVTGDYRESQIRLRMAPLDMSQADGYVRSLYWAESDRHHNTALDKIPVELLRLWCITDPDKIAALIPELLEHPEKFRSEEFAGAWVFLHYHCITVKTCDPVQRAATYREFHEMVQTWLTLDDRGEKIKYVNPFLFNKYPEQLARLRAEKERSDIETLHKTTIRGDALKEFLLGIQASNHALYTFLERLPETEFYIYLSPEEDMQEGRHLTMQQFFAECDTLASDATVGLNMFLCEDETDVDTLVSRWVLYSNSIDLLIDLSTENLQAIFEEFLACYCEKHLRSNTPFCMMEETIRRFGFTDKDVSTLQPLIDRLNEEAKKRIRKEYNALARLDFIRAEFNQSGQ